MEPPPFEQTGFTGEIGHFGHYYKVHVRYAFPLTEEERKVYKSEHGEFLIELTDSSETKKFKVFQDENLEWRSDALPLLVDQRLIGIIGGWIDSRFE